MAFRCRHLCRCLRYLQSRLCLCLSHKWEPAFQVATRVLNGAAHSEELVPNALALPLEVGLDTFRRQNFENRLFLSAASILQTEFSRFRTECMRAINQMLWNWETQPTVTRKTHVTDDANPPLRSVKTSGLCLPGA